jgi:hypothetical protein
MTKNLFTNVIVVAACFLFQGCYHFQDPRQKNWHDEILRASLAVNRATVKKSAFIVDKQLVDFIGEPDFKLSPFELQELLIEDEPYRKKVMDHVRYSYCLAKRDVALREAAGSHYAPVTNNWKECAEFNKCSLWLYDETRHFSKPMVWGLGYNEGFLCKIFFVERSNVIGDSSVIFWKPLRSLPQQ